MTVLIAGAGIAGLVMGLTLHQIGLPFRIFERVANPRPLGVGINLQPNAVRELIDLEIAAGRDRHPHPSVWFLHPVRPRDLG